MKQSEAPSREIPNLYRSDLSALKSARVSTPIQELKTLLSSSFDRLRPEILGNSETLIDLRALIEQIESNISSKQPAAAILKRVEELLSIVKKELYSGAAHVVQLSNQVDRRSIIAFDSKFERGYVSIGLEHEKCGILDLFDPAQTRLKKLRFDNIKLIGFTQKGWCYANGDIDGNGVIYNLNTAEKVEGISESPRSKNLSYSIVDIVTLPAKHPKEPIKEIAIVEQTSFDKKLIVKSRALILCEVTETGFKALRRIAVPKNKQDCKLELVNDTKGKTYHLAVMKLKANDSTSLNYVPTVIDLRTLKSTHFPSRPAQTRVYEIASFSVNLTGQPLLTVESRRSDSSQSLELPGLNIHRYVKSHLGWKPITIEEPWKGRTSLRIEDSEGNRINLPFKVLEPGLDLEQFHKLQIDTIPTRPSSDRGSVDRFAIGELRSNSIRTRPHQLALLDRQSHQKSHPVISPPLEVICSDIISGPDGFYAVGKSIHSSLLIPFKIPHNYVDTRRRFEQIGNGTELAQYYDHVFSRDKKSGFLIGLNNADLRFTVLDLVNNREFASPFNLRIHVITPKLIQVGESEVALFCAIEANDGSVSPVLIELARLSETLAKQRS